MSRLFPLLGLFSIILLVLHLLAYQWWLFVELPLMGYMIPLIKDVHFAKDPLLCKTVCLLLLMYSSLGASLYRKTNIVLTFAVFLLSSVAFMCAHLVLNPGTAYLWTVLVGFILSYFAAYLIGAYIGLLGSVTMEDCAVKVNFMQETKYSANSSSINLPTLFTYNDRTYRGWINVVNPFRATMVLGLPGSGKSYSIFNHFIQQAFEKEYTMFCYDYKYPALSKVVYNVLKENAHRYKKMPHFYVINLDDATKTHRCNPLNPVFLTEIMDAYEAAYMVLINLNKTWVQKQGDFFVDSAIIYFTAIIWFLKRYQNGKYCTLPHAVELLMKPYLPVFTMLQKEEEIQNYLAPFLNAEEGNAQEQLQGQLASAQIPLMRLSSPSLYWALSGDDFTLDINNPDDPKVICMANNPDRQSIYAGALSLYTSRLFKIINRPHKQKCMVLLDELPTIYIKGLDNLIATARSNKVAIVVGAQDLSQITRDYGEKEADVIFNTVGNVFAGQVKGRTAKAMSETFGKIYVEKTSVSLHGRSDNDNVSISNSQEDLIPTGVISALSQGTFVGQVADDHGQKIKQKFFHAEIIPNEKILSGEPGFMEIPRLASCSRGDMNDLVQRNYMDIKNDISKMLEPYL